MVDFYPVYTALNLIQAMKEMLSLPAVATKEVTVTPDLATGDVQIVWTGLLDQQETLLVPYNTDYSPLLPPYIERIQAASLRRTVRLAPEWFPTTEDADQLANQSGPDWRLLGLVGAWDSEVLEHLVLNVLVPTAGKISAEDPAMAALPWWPS